MHKTTKISGGVVALLASMAMTNALQAADASDLGGVLTPVGAERAGNADGSIPAWTGGNTDPVPGWSAGDPRVDLFASDEKLFTIDASNVDQYADKLSKGQIELIKRYDDYRMDIYPTRRSCGYPDDIYERTKANITEASVGPDGEILSGYGGFLFPLPENGWETVLNHRTAFRGRAEDHTVSMAVVRGNGGYNLNVGRMKILKPFFSGKTKDESDGYMGKLIYTQTAPAVAVGGVLLSLEPYNGPNDTWGYIPGLRRVKKAPTASYDNPVPSQDDLRTFDQTFMFNGPGDRYNWKLLGKQEHYVPYNAAQLRGANVSIDDIVGEKFPNRDLTRYELHRVWVVEATVKEDARNVFKRRVFYIDEDTWTILVADLYDGHDKLWRFQENHIFMAPEIPACVTSGDFYFDLNAGRYIADNLIVGDGNANYVAVDSVDDNMFTPSALRRAGRR